ncbi:WXG100 family type VII secretion target [Streptomyces sp. NPDC049040]|uniref:WXG100 family type VII secretion target n=1 Tax=Streptomyces sp. NPDC049040 TaxID=3365593 RepID=UPI00371EDE0B
MGNADDDQILDIKLADLQTSAPQFLTHSSDLATALAKLQGGLAAAGSPWGGDDQGKQFEDQYVPNVTSMTMAAEVLALGLASIHDAMVDMADGHVGNEELIRLMFSRNGPKPEPPPHTAGGGVQ